MGWLQDISIDSCPALCCSPYVVPGNQYPSFLSILCFSVSTRSCRHNCSTILLHKYCSPGSSTASIKFIQHNITWFRNWASNFVPGIASLLASFLSILFFSMSTRSSISRWCPLYGSSTNACFNYGAIFFLRKQDFSGIKCFQNLFFSAHVRNKKNPSKLPT